MEEGPHVRKKLPHEDEKEAVNHRERGTKIGAW